MKTKSDKIFISLIQMDIAWEKIPVNLMNLEKKIKEIPPETEIIILPEMFSTGFTMNVDELPKPLGLKSFEWLKTKAKESGKIILGSILTEDRGKYYNRMYWMRPDGTFDYYDKRHLFHMGGEHKVMTAGKDRKIITYNNLKFMLQICYDLRFPVWSKNRYNKEKDSYVYDVLVYIANWPESRKQAYLNLLKARAIENQSYVIWVNRTGKDGKGNSHSGDSLLIDPIGNIVDISPSQQEHILNIELTPEFIIKLRSEFKVGMDWDNYKIFF